MKGTNKCSYIKKDGSTCGKSCIAEIYGLHRFYLANLKSPERDFLICGKRISVKNKYGKCGKCSGYDRIMEVGRRKAQTTA